MDRESRAKRSRHLARKISIKCVPQLLVEFFMAHTKKRISRLDYCQYLLSAQTNYTLTNYADHCATLSHLLNIA
jgi:hypothetical protein